eukprot:7238072-Prymnesium_polylepis.2
MHGKVLTISSEDLTLNTLSLAAGVSPFAIGGFKWCADFGSTAWVPSVNPILEAITTDTNLLDDDDVYTDKMIYILINPP